MAAGGPLTGPADGGTATKRRMGMGLPVKSRGLVAAAATVLSLALLLPAQAQFWEPWGGRQQQQQRQQPSSPFGGGFWSRDSRYRSIASATRPARSPDRLFARAGAGAEEARGHHQHRGDGRRDGRLAGARARRSVLRKAGDRHRAQASHRVRPHPLRSAPRHRVAADRQGNHRGREAQIHRHDGRQQRPPVDPREGAGRPSGRAGSTEAAAGATAQQAQSTTPPAPQAATARSPIRSSRRPRRKKIPSRRPRPSRSARARSARGSSTPRSGRPPISGASTPPWRH